MCLSWAQLGGLSSKKQHAISCSNTKGEYRSLASLVVELIWIRSLLSKIGVHLPFPPVVYSDNNSIVLLVAKLVLHSRSKHFELDLHFVWDHVA